MIDYRKEGELHIVTMSERASTICPDWQQRMLEILDIIEGDCGQGSAMVLTGVDKFFCNGLNLEVLMQLAPEAMAQFGQKSKEIHSRLLVLPCPTVAAMNGHAFAADGKASQEQLLQQAMSLAGELATKEPGIFKTLKQTWFGPLADALIAS